jgi:hypothetical protein
MIDGYGWEDEDRQLQYVNDGCEDAYPDPDESAARRCRQNFVNLDMRPDSQRVHNNQPQRPPDGGIGAVAGAGYIILTIEAEFLPFRLCTGNNAAFSMASI